MGTAEMIQKVSETRQKKVLAIANRNATMMIAKAQRQALEIKQKAMGKTDIIKKKAKQKGKKIVLTATNKAYDVKNMEAKEKIAEVAKKALDKKKEANRRSSAKL